VSFGRVKIVSAVALRHYVARVLIGRLRVLGLLVPLVASAACTGDATQKDDVIPVDVAVQSYAAAEGVPGWCTRLARSTHLTDVPAAIGTLTARHDDVEAKLALAAAADDVEAVAAEIPEGAQTDVTGALDRLAAALAQAADGPLTIVARDAVSGALDDLGRLVQPLCEFPV
jgi:hypothetical protein